MIIDHHHHHHQDTSLGFVDRTKLLFSPYDAKQDFRTCSKCIMSIGTKNPKIFRDQNSYINMCHRRMVQKNPEYKSMPTCLLKLMKKGVHHPAHTDENGKHHKEFNLAAIVNDKNKIDLDSCETKCSKLIADSAKDLAKETPVSWDDFKRQSSIPSILVLPPRRDLFRNFL